MGMGSMLYDQKKKWNKLGILVDMGVERIFLRKNYPKDPYSPSRKLSGKLSTFPIDTPNDIVDIRMKTGVEPS